MEVLGKRKKGIIWLYLFTLLLGIIILIFGIVSIKNNEKEDAIPLLIISLILIIISIWLVIDILKTPKNIILYNSDSYTLKVLNQTIFLNEIRDVQYKKSKAKHIEYKFGTVFIVLNDKKIKCKYVSDCELVAKKIYDLSIKTKQLEL